MRLYPVAGTRLCLYCRILAEAAVVTDPEPGHRDGCPVASVPLEHAACTCGLEVV